MNEKFPRKLVAILYADVADYSRLTGEDEDATHSVLRRYLDLISTTVQSYQGQVMHYAGDAVLARFGAVVDALSAAINIQQQIREAERNAPDGRKVRFRVGVNSGDVIEDRGDIYGDGVNVAARLESLAPPGGICVSDAVRSAVGKKLALQYEDMGDQRVKNIAEPVRTYRVVMIDDKQPSTNNSVRHSIEESAKPSIAVLPFLNMSGDREQEYFSDGISEDLITDLSRIPGLFVIARNSSFSYKGQSVIVQRVSAELGVRYIVEGSVRKAADRIRITAQLIDATTGGHVWAERYDRNLDDIFAVQDEITVKIVSALQLVLLPGGTGVAAKSPTSDFQAYDYYLKGRQCFHGGLKANFIEARIWFERAIECDSEFARAFCGLADCGTRLYSSYEHDRKYRDGVMAALNRALELDPDLAEAHASLGLALSGSMQDALTVAGETRSAEAEFARAIELDPNLYEPHFYWGQLCFEQGNLSAAAEHFEQALIVSPRDSKAPSLLIGIYRDLQCPQEMKTAAGKALDAAMRSLELDADDSANCLTCASALIALDRTSEAITMMERAIKIDPTDRIVLYNMACAHATMNEKDRALDYLEQMSVTGHKNVDWITNDSDLDSLRDHPRFKAIMKRLAGSSGSDDN